MPGDFQEVEDAGEAGFAGQLGRDVREADGRDGVDLDVAISHFVAVAGDDMRAGPDADRAGDLAADDSLAKAFGEDHKYRLQFIVRSSEFIVHSRWMLGRLG